MWRYGAAATASAFIGTFWLGREDTHYRLVLTRTAPDAVADAAEDEDIQLFKTDLNMSLKDHHNQRHNRGTTGTTGGRDGQMVVDVAWWQDQRSTWHSFVQRTAPAV